jgi:hypothetical protein
MWNGDKQTHKGSEKRVKKLRTWHDKIMLEEFVKNDLVELYELFSIRAVSGDSAYLICTYW